MRCSVFAAVVLASSVGAVATLSAKGPTVKLTVTGPTLTQPVHITHSPALAHVWSDDFIGAISEAPDPDLPRVQVSFHVQPNGSRAVKVMYTVTYVYEPGSGNAFVYLPGPGEEHYDRNVSTISRAGHDGRWHKAVDQWARSVNDALR